MSDFKYILRHCLNEYVTIRDISKKQVIENMRKNGFPKCEVKALYFYVNGFDTNLPANAQERYNWREMQDHFAWAFEIETNELTINNIKLHMLIRRKDAKLTTGNFRIFKKINKDTWEIVQLDGSDAQYLHKSDLKHWQIEHY